MRWVCVCVCFALFHSFKKDLESFILLPRASYIFLYTHMHGSGQNNPVHILVVASHGTLLDIRCRPYIY